MSDAEPVRGVVISVHELGAAVRLADGTLASASAADVRAHRARFVASCGSRAPLEFAVVERRGRRALVALAGAAAARPAEPAAGAAAAGSDATDAEFEARIAAYLKSTQTWAPPDRPEPAERHFIRKKRRAAFFEARKAGT